MTNYIEYVLLKHIAEVEKSENNAGAEPQEGSEEQQV